MNRLESVVFGMAVGAGLTYFLDRDRGRRRRALVRDRMVHAGHEIEDAARSGARHARNRATGLLHEAGAAVREGQVDDRVLEERVRSAFGRTVSDAGAIEVSAHDGSVTLSGEVEADEVQDLVRTVRRVRGVDHVDNRLNVRSRTNES